MVSVWGALCLSSSLFKPLRRRYTVYVELELVQAHMAQKPVLRVEVSTVNISNRAVNCCKAPLWGRRLDLDYQDLTPRFAHRPLLLL